MIVIMEDGATQQDIDKVQDRIRELGYTPHLIQGVKKNIIGIVGDLDREELVESLGAYPEIESLVPIQKPYKLVGRGFKDAPTVIEIGPDLIIGGEEIVVMAGPCAVEDEEQIMETARTVAAGGAKILRGGAFKPRTSPYSFQGLHERGLKLLRQAADATGLKVITEVMDPRQVELIGNYTDIFQIGARNMQNFYLLKEVGKAEKPVMLKRGMSATYREFLMAAEYIMSQGNYNVILCERGIRTFEDYTRNTLDLMSIPVLDNLSHLPIVVDPSHGTGQRELIEPAARGAVAMGADGLMIEVHPQPARALSDGAQSIESDNFADLMNKLQKIALAVDRKF